LEKGRDRHLASRLPYYDDGVSSACGMSDNWLYLGFIHRPPVQAWLDAHGVNLGNSDQPASHWLVIDSTTGDCYAAPRREAHAIVFRQELPGAEQGSDRP
jgi:hypothetical protein